MLIDFTQNLTDFVLEPHQQYKLRKSQVGALFVKKKSPWFCVCVRVYRLIIYKHNGEYKIFFKFHYHSFYEQAKIP